MFEYKKCAVVIGSVTVEGERMVGLRVVWLSGAPGTGKSTLAWYLLVRLGERERERTPGAAVGHLDIDQLGMLSVPPDDPDRHSVKAVTPEGLLPNFATAGVETVPVSGVVDDGRCGGSRPAVVDRRAGSVSAACQRGGGSSGHSWFSETISRAQTRCREGVPCHPSSKRTA